MGVTGTTDMSVMGEGNWSSAGLADSREDERGEELRAACCCPLLVDFVTISGVTEIVGTG